MNKLPSIAGIGYLIYAASIIFFISSRIIATLNRAAANADTNSLSRSDLIPLINLSVISFVIIILIIFLSFFLLKRRHRVACIVLAVIICIDIPIGTLLGIFTIIVLTRADIKAKFS